jgi:FtsP/CotA-like multicopper oxidase with cupredoxin domain
MRHRTKELTRAGALFLVIAALLAVPALSASGTSRGVGLVRPVVRPAVRSALAAPLAALTGTDIWMCAVDGGSVTMPDGVAVPFWAFVEDTNLGAAGGCAAPALPGPLLDLAQGAVVTVHLTNQIPGQRVSIVFEGQAGVPDRTGVITGNTAAYMVNATDPGTYLYEAGTDVSRQVPMGLSGAMIVRPTTPGRAYADAITAYDVESVLVLSEIDPALNANPATFNPLNFDPEYFLINGLPWDPKPAATNPVISATAGQRVLLRYVNAGSEHHTMMLLGARETFIAKDAFPIRFPYSLTSETIPTGSTADAIVTVPAVPSGTRFPLFNRNMELTNGAFPNSDHSPGGMMTFIQVP